jgi:hypothetical protein
MIAHATTPLGPPGRRSRSGAKRSTSSGRGRSRPHEIGDASEVEAIAALSRAGYIVSIPFGAHPRYDCIIDRGGVIQRVQIKTGYEDGYGAVRWECRSRRFYDGLSRSYHTQADLFAVWVPETRQCFLVPVEECGRYAAALRIVPPRNGQHRRVRLAADYALTSGVAGAGAPSP